MNKGLKCRTCRYEKGIPEHIRLICEAAEFRYALSYDAQPYFDWWLGEIMHSPERRKKFILGTL